MLAILIAVASITNKNKTIVGLSYIIMYKSIFLPLSHTIFPHPLTFCVKSIHISLQYQIFLLSL